MLNENIKIGNFQIKKKSVIQKKKFLDYFKILLKVKMQFYHLWMKIIKILIKKK